jgi:hypothetical protein
MTYLYESEMKMKWLYRMRMAENIESLFGAAGGK